MKILNWLKKLKDKHYRKSGSYYTIGYKSRLVFNENKRNKK